MNLKAITGRHAGVLANNFNEWWQPEWNKPIMAEVVQERNGNLAIIVLHDNAEPQEEQPEPSEEPKPVVNDEGNEIVQEDMLCPHCQVLVRPGVVERGPYAGRMKCPQCNKTFVREEGNTNG